MVIKFGWGMISGIHHDSKNALDILTDWRVLNKIETSRERRLHLKMAKPIKPIEIPVSFRSFTFFTATKNNELARGMHAVDNTISLLLI